MRNCGSLPQPSAVILLRLSISDPPTPVSILYVLVKIFSFSFFLFHPVSHLSCLSSIDNILSFLYFPSSLAPYPILNRPTVFHSHPPYSPILLHSLPTKFLSLRGWDEGVLNLKSLVRKLTGMGHSHCCSHQAGHSCAQAGTPLVL